MKHHIIKLLAKSRCTRASGSLDERLHEHSRSTSKRREALLGLVEREPVGADVCTEAAALSLTSAGSS
jgi:hypothetical protein